MNTEARIDHIEKLLAQMGEVVGDLTAASSATYALNRTLLLTMVSVLKAQGTDMSVFTLLFSESAFEQADDFEGEKRRIFMDELGRWLEVLTPE